MPKSEELAAVYADAYSGGDDQPMLATPSMLAEQYVDALMDFEGLSNLKGKRILDFGAGHGFVSRELSSRGAAVMAVEPFGAKNWSIDEVPVFSTREDLKAKAAWKESFDGAVMVEVLEHLPSPKVVLGTIKEALREGGWLFLTTPNAGSARAMLTGPRWDSYAKAGHLILFTTRSLEILLRKCSFCEISFLRAPVQFTRSKPRNFIQALLQRLLLGGNLKVVAKSSARPHRSGG